MSQSHENRSLSIAYAQLTFQATHDVLSFGPLTRCEQLGDDGNLLLLTLNVMSVSARSRGVDETNRVTSAERDLLEV